MIVNGEELLDLDIVKALLYTYKKQKKTLSEGLVKGLEKVALTQMVNNTEDIAIMIKKGQIEDFKEVYYYEL